MAHKKGPRTARKHNAKYSDKQILRPDKRPNHDRRRAHADRLAPRRSCCYNPDVRRGLGAVVFVLGFPTAIAGIVMTVVDATDNNEEGSKYPSAFAYVGPILITVAIIMILVGFVLSTPVVSKALGRCFSFDDPNGFCRVHCPRLSQCIKPDDIIIMNRHAMDALKSEPGKPALKRKPPEENVSMNGTTKEGELLTRSLSDPVSVESGEAKEPLPATDDNVDVVSELKLGYRKGNKGVRFSESDLDDVRKVRTSSVTSSDNGSILSLRNFKVHPKTEIWCTDTPGGAFNRVLPAQPSTSGQHYTTEL